MNEILVKVLNKLKIFKYFNFSKTIRINDKKFIVPVINDVGSSNLYISEPWMINVLKIAFSISGKSFIDVGINTGQTLLKIKSVSPEINYIGFEPNPFCINYLQRLIQVNNFQNTTILPVGISNKTEIGTLHFMNDSIVDSSASSIGNFREEHKEKKKTYIPLFDYKDLKDKVNLDKISILKIDVEGGELEVIKSFKEDIAKDEPIILMEVLPVYNDLSTFRIERQNKIQELLRNLDYEIFRVIKQNKLLLRFDKIKEIGIHSDLDRCDYVMVPKSRVTQFIEIAKDFIGY
ncbi:FkbM family methyltransferase [Sabulilitoribacter multivorans]|uniref:FkbM family methyltransferase n=1 Tax=Flaviramulus multivorans TaxID=1304750 RepID=A0ABS9IMN6_9FLAO|nr:FkbM family methyltransferase [Flaviramulus multivorans]MCF7561833.1 FkbM family methyltransferase [Flaviramulus multivorans]